MDSPSGGLAFSLRRLASTGLALLQTRLELLSVELQEERLRLTTLLALGAAAFFFLGFGLVFLAGFFTVLLWESHRLLALGIATSVFLLAGIVCLIGAMRHSRSGSRLFAASLSELVHDRDALGERP